MTPSIPENPQPSAHASRSSDELTGVASWLPPLLREVGNDADIDFVSVESTFRLAGRFRVTSQEELEELFEEARAPRMILVTRYWVETASGSKLQLFIGSRFAADEKLQEEAEKLNGKNVEVEAAARAGRVANTGRIAPNSTDGDYSFFLKSIAERN